MEVSTMKLKILKWEYDEDIFGFASAISRKGYGLNRFIDMVVTEGPDGTHWEIVPGFADRQEGWASSLEEGKRAAVRAALKLLVHSVLPSTARRSLA